MLLRARGKNKNHEAFPSITEVRREEIDDMYALPPLQEEEKNSSEEEDEKEWEIRMTQRKMLHEALCENPQSVDIESEDFKKLPPEVKYEILTEMKEFTKRKRTFFEAMPEESNAFSQYQLRGLLKKSSLSRCIENVQKELSQQQTGEIQTQYENEGGFVKEVEYRKVVSEDTSHYILIKGIKANEATSQDLEAIAGPSSKMPELTKLKEITESPANAKLVETEKLQTEKDNNVVTAPPSPRTLLAIQTAMLESSSEEELGDEDTGRLNMDLSVAEEGSVSPRTLHAIQLALSDGDDDDTIEEVVTVKTDRVLPERSEVKDLLLSSSDDEDQIPEVKERRIPTSAINLSNQVVMRDAEFEQRSQELDKNHITTKGTIISRHENYSCIDNTRKGKEGADKEENCSKIELNCLGDDNINLCLQKPNCFPVQTSIEALIHAETAGLSENKENLKISLDVEEEVLQTEENVSEVQKDIILFPEAKSPEEEKEEISQSEDSDSDGSFIEVETEIGNEAEFPVKCGEELGDETALPAVETDRHDTVTQDLLKESEVQLANNQSVEREDDDKDAEDNWQDISMEELEELENDLSAEQNKLQAQKQQQERVAASVTGQMCLESQELLRLFGIPYIEAPMEAEAQCAVLDLTDQTSGTITDDSDVWLFGARHVYKNFFSQNQYVEYYQYVDFQNQLGLDRSKLINLAYLLGSDYTEGIANVGFVTAMEILNEFPGHGLEPLLKFAEWWNEAQKNKKLRPNPRDTKVKKKLRDLQLSSGFPNPAVAEAYLNPVVDETRGSFIWGKPDVEQIREFCQNRFGWTRVKTDEILLPVMKQLNLQQTQLRIDSFFRLEQHEKIAIKSQRLRRAVTCLKRKEKEAADDIQEIELKAHEERKGEDIAGCTDHQATEVQNGKRRKHSDSRKEHVYGGGFIGNLHLSETSSDSSVEESESRDLGRRKRRKKVSAMESAGSKEKKKCSSSSGEDEELGKIILVTAKPVFEGKKKKSQSKRRVKKKTS
ncbi:DNA excision repair protein ERCC-5 isoform X2 [Melopsittacus undulatus]|uniref:DNA excision repair protein ERCC-5 isoform X2 n=1 Tax=Melopsittacus undulatus TaxID=13146 RepID=UPI00146A0C2A|nr:DNA repair protein complementing XP-G cells isoform X2 [Melopsittacus undulatus]